MKRTWPDGFERLLRGEGCPMCASLGTTDNEHGVRVLDGSFANVYLQRRAPQRGYAIAIWKHGHVAEPSDLSAAQRSGYFEEVWGTGAALMRITNAAKMNYQVLGNTVPHLHTHIFSRYLDDPAPSRPLPPESFFDPPLLEPDQLRRDADALSALLRSSA